MLIGQTNDVTFKVNVMGTSTDPKVKLVLNTTPEMSFPATKKGESWHASVTVPDHVKPGKYSLRVEVVIGNRHFSPLTKSVKLELSPNMVPAAPTPTPEPAVETVPEMAEAAPVEAAVETPAEIFLPEPVAPKAPRAKKMVKLPADLFSVENLMGSKTPVVIDRRPIIARDPVITAMDPPIQMLEEKMPKKRIVELKHTLPTRLIKGEIIYE
jgi:hypothetical protein